MNGRHVRGLPRAIQNPAYRPADPAQGGSAETPPGPRHSGASRGSLDIALRGTENSAPPDTRYAIAFRPSMTHGYLERPDCRLYYQVSGQGPLLVFAHGLGGNHMKRRT